MSKGSWDEFVAYLDKVYLPSLTPELRALECPDADIPEDVWRAAKTIFPNAEGWLDNPIPQLGRKSAGEAIKAGRADEVRTIMMGVAEFFLPPEDEVVPYEEWESGVELPPGDDPGQAG